MKRKLILLALFVLACLSLAACEQSKASSAGIAVLDNEKVFQRSKLAQAAMAYVQQQSAAMNGRLLELQKAIQEKPEDEKVSAEAQAEFSRLQQDFEQVQTATAEKLNGLFLGVVDEYRAAKGFHMILPKTVVMSVNPEADITEGVIELLDQRTIDFAAPPAGEGQAGGPAAAD
jgi:Skp family chaperone for outer membrane proteins